MSDQLSAEQKERIFLTSGDTHPELAVQVAHHMGLELGNVALRSHPNTEPYVRFEESIRGRHVIILQSHAPANGRSVSDSLHQHLEMIYAAKYASGEPITAVAPNLAGARQDRKSRGRESVSIGLTLQALEMAGASRLVTVDLHSHQSLVGFRRPADHLTALHLLQNALGAEITDEKKGYVVVSPDEGRAKLSRVYARELGVGVRHMIKDRDSNDPTHIIRPNKKMEGVDGMTCFLVDDMIDTAGTVQSAAEVLYASGAKRIVAAATHGWFSEPAIERLKTSPIDQLIVTDTLPISDAEHELGDQLRVISVAPMMARALIAIATNSSVSSLFGDRNHS